MLECTIDVYIKQEIKTSILLTSGRFKFQCLDELGGEDDIVSETRGRLGNH